MAVHSVEDFVDCLTESPGVLDEPEFDFANFEANEGDDHSQVC
jgi:hypothetical protein